MTNVKLLIFLTNLTIIFFRLFCHEIFLVNVQSNHIHWAEFSISRMPFWLQRVTRLLVLFAKLNRSTIMFRIICTYRRYFVDIFVANSNFMYSDSVTLQPGNPGFGKLYHYYVYPVKLTVRLVKSRFLYAGMSYTLRKCCNSHVL